MVTSLSAAEILTRVDALAARLGDRAQEAEHHRRVPASTVDEIVRDELWPMVVPTSVGGHGLGFATLAESTRRLARACPATAWTVSFLTMHNWMVNAFPAEARAEAFQVTRPYALVAAPLAPTGTISPVDGGYLVSGRWDWATGVHHADWVMVHAIQTEPSFTTRFALVPVGDVTIDDVWHTSGMRATGSDTVRVEHYFVPVHRAIEARTLLDGGGDDIAGDGMAGLPVAPVLGLTASAPALGAAEAAVSLYQARIQDRILAYTLGDKAIDQPAAQMRLGAALSLLADARTRWEHAVRDLDAMAGRDVVLTVEERMAFRLTAAATVRSARAIVALIAEGAGASVYFESSPFQRIQRDLDVLKGHVVFDWDRTTELAGRVALGLPLSPTEMI